jgi:hypothetical protein
MFRLILAAALLLACLSTSPALAAGHWVRSCGPTGCQVQWVEDRPQARYVAPQAHQSVSQFCATCYGCRCPTQGRNAQCERMGCMEGAKPQSVSYSSQGNRRRWWVGKAFGRACPQ